MSWLLAQPLAPFLFLVFSSCVLMFVLTTISMVGLFAISDLIVDILFKRGKFGLGDVIATSDAIVMYAIGLPAFGFIKIFSVKTFCGRCNRKH